MIRGTFQSLTTQGISVILVFLCNLLLARWAGPEGYSKYVHVFNWLSILSVCAIGGREDLAISEISRYQRDHQPDRILSLTGSINRGTLMAALLIGGVFTGIIFLIPFKTFYEYRFDFLIGTGAIYFMAFLTVNQFVLQSLDYIRESQWVERLIKPLLMIIFFAIARLFAKPLTGTLLIVITETIMGICCAILAVLVTQKLRKFRFPGKPRARPAPPAKKRLYFFFITLLTLLVTKLSMLILPYYTPRKDIGIFNIAYRFADLIVYPFFLMHTVLPQLFARHEDASITHKQSLYAASTKLMLALSLPLLAINVLGGRIFLGWFGNAFADGYAALVLLSIAQSLFSLFGPANTVLMMQNRERQAVLALGVHVVVLLVANLLLIPVLGITGGALALLIACLIYNLVLAVMVYRFCGVISPFFTFLGPVRR
jgi:O-antigen/teichoic acid export membrane protein